MVSSSFGCLNTFIQQCYNMHALCHKRVRAPRYCARPITMCTQTSYFKILLVISPSFFLFCAKLFIIMMNMDESLSLSQMMDDREISKSNATEWHSYFFKPFTKTRLMAQVLSANFFNIVQ